MEGPGGTVAWSAHDGAVERRALALALAAMVIVALVLWLPRSEPLGGFAGQPAAVEEADVERDYANLPLAFEPNRGQAGGGADFVSRGPGYSLSLAPNSAMLAIDGDERGLAVSMRLVGGRAAAAAEPRRRLPGEVNYLVGERSEWRTGVPTYERVAYRSVWPGTDVVWYGNRDRLEYDFRLAPGADPGQIGLRFAGQDALRVAANGDLVLESGAGAVSQRAPVAYQRVDGERVPVDSSYVLHGERTVGLRISSYDASRPLIIDPLLMTYSTFIGGSGNDFARALAVDGSGAAYLMGEAEAGYPTTAGAFDQTHGGGTDAFVTKLNPAGTALVYSTFMGGSGSELGHSIAVGGDGSAYVTGQTPDAATDYPTTAGAFDQTPNGSFDVFVTKLNAAGSALSYSTLVGGSGVDVGFGIAVGGDGSAYLTGETSDATTDFPSTSGSFDLSPNGVDDAFATKVNPAGSALSYSTFLGGSDDDVGFGIAVDGSGAAYVTGRTTDAGTDFPTTAGSFDTVHNGGNDVFATKLSPAGSALSYSTLIGGAGLDTPGGIAVDGSGAAYLTGVTADAATDFPTTAGSVDPTQNGFNDAFATKLNPAGSALSYSTMLGGAGNDVGEAIAIDGSGAAFITGDTDNAATDYPTTAGAFDQTHNGGTSDAFATKLSTTGDALAYSTFLGGGGGEVGLGIAVDGSGAAYLGGIALAADYPTTPGAHDTSHNGARDGFVTKLTPPAIAVSNQGVVEGDAGEQSAVLDVTMEAPNESTVRIDFATEDASAQAPGDYAATSGSLIFHPGQTSRRIEIPIADDALDEPVQTFRVRLSNARFAPFADAVGAVTITDDDDPPALTLNNKSLAEGNSGTRNAVFRLALDGPSQKTVRASFETDDRTATSPSDYVEKDGTLTFAPGVVARNVPVAIVGDVAAEPTEAFRLLITGAQNAAVLDGSGTGQIVDDD